MSTMELNNYMVLSEELWRSSSPAKQKKRHDQTEACLPEIYILREQVIIWQHVGPNFIDIYTMKNSLEKKNGGKSRRVSELHHEM